MLDQLELAIRRYRQIAPDPGAPMTLTQAEQLTEWLEFDVGRIVQSLLDRPGFRRRVRWPIDLLSRQERPGSGFTSPQRELVFQVDRSVVAFAKRLVQIANSEPTRSALQASAQMPQTNDPLGDELHPFAGLPPIGLARIESIASRSWDDLVSIRDFFAPMQPPLDGGMLQHGSFLPLANPRLRAPGDFITRCLEIRISELLEDLTQFYRRLWDMHPPHVPGRSPDLETLASQLAELRSTVDELRRVCFDGPDARVRDSCIALLQVYVAFRLNTDLHWLGTPPELVAGIADIPQRVRRRLQWDVPERAVAALIDITDLVRRKQSPEDVIEEKKATKRLVLVEEQRAVYLDGRPADVGEANWHGRHNLLWELLWELADRARIERSVDAYRLSNLKAPKPEHNNQPPEPLSEQAVKDRRSDLKKIISPELNELIVSAGAGTYRMTLDPSEISLLGWFTEETIVELDVHPARPSTTQLAHRLDELD